MMEEIETMNDNSEHTADQSAVRGSGKLSDCSKGGGPSLHYEGIIKKGILNKKGRKKIFRPWVLRTIVLDDRHMLSYYDGTTLKGCINLIGTSTNLVPPEKADGRNFAFEITNISTTRTFQRNSLLLAASSQAEADEWVNAIISMMQKHDSAKVNFEYESFEVSTDSLSRDYYQFMLVF